MKQNTFARNPPYVMAQRAHGPIVVAALLAALLATSARAEVYVAAAFGPARYQVRCDGGACDRRDNGFRIAAGWGFAQRWSAELFYLDAGSYTASDVTANGVPFRGRASARGFGASVAYALPLGDKFDLAARLGAASLQSNFSPGPAPAIAGGRTNTQLLYGLGGRWKFSTSWALRADWDHTRARMNRFYGDVDSFSVGLQFSF